MVKKIHIISIIINLFFIFHSRIQLLVHLDQFVGKCLMLYLVLHESGFNITTNRWKQKTVIYVGNSI